MKIIIIFSRLFRARLAQIFLAAILYFIFSLLVVNAALVPCGTSANPTACNWCHLMQVIKNIIDLLMSIVFPLAAVMIVIGGITIATAGGSTERVAKGRQIVTAAVIGILIALLSWLIIDTIIKVVATNWGSLKIGPWNKLGC